MTDGKLYSGRYLLPEQTLISVGGRAHLHYQGDGNLVVYLNGTPVWATMTDGQPAGMLKMRADGDMVVQLPDGSGIAHSNTAGHPKAMVQLQDDGNFVIYEDPNGPLAGTPVWASASSQFIHEHVAPEPVPTECPKPLRGRVRRDGKLLADDSGRVTPIMGSLFNLLRRLKDDPAFAINCINDTVRARLQGDRVFLYVGGWMGFWAPDYGVYPVTCRPWYFDRKDGHLRPATDANGQPMYGPTIPAWPDWDGLFGRLCEEYARRGLKLHLTAGDTQIICPDVNAEIAIHERAARIVKQIDPTLVAFWEIRNEYPMNSPQGGNRFDRDNMGRVIRAVQGILPGQLCGMGAALSEEPAQLYESVEHGDICFQHTSREPFELCLKRTLGLVYWEGDWRHFSHPFGNGEPKPINIPPFGDAIGDDGYAPSDRVDQLFALHAMIAATSQYGNVFTGASVRLQTYPSQMPGYNEIVAMIERHIPEDIDTWDRQYGPNGAILYFMKGNQFLTSTHETWSTQPPRPVASWTMYTGRGTTPEVLTGTGNPPQGRTGFIVGTFAN